MEHVLLVEDAKYTREHLQNCIAKDSHFSVDATGSYHQALKNLGLKTYAFLVLDIGLPDGNGLNLIPVALKHNPNMLILILTVFGTDEYVIKAMQSGAKGYLLKDKALEEIQDVLISMEQGASPIDQRVARALLQLIEQHEPRGNDALLSLTATERMVLSHISVGKMYKEVAFDMEVSINTVREHIRRIYKKMGVNSRAQAIRAANKLNLD